MGKTSISTLSAFLNLDTSGFTQGIAKAKSASSKFSKDLKKQPAGEEYFDGLIKKAAGAVAAYASVSYAIGKLHAAGEQLEAIDKASRSLQINPESYQELAYIAKQSGVETEALVKSSAKLPKILGEALDAGSPMAQVFSRLKLDAAALQTMSPDEGFKKVITALQGVEGANERAYLAQEVFGKAGHELLPLMYEDINELADASKNLGLIVSQDGVNSTKIMGDAFQDLSLQGDATWQNILVGLAPLGTEFARTMSGWVTALGGPEGIANNLMWVIGAIGDVGHQVFYGLKTAGLAFDTAFIAVIEGIVKGIEWMADGLNNVINDAIKKLSWLKEKAGGDPIKFRFEKVNIGGDFLGEMREQLAKETVEMSKELEKSTAFSDALAELTASHKKEARALSDKQNQMNKVGGAYDAIVQKTEKATAATNKQIDAIKTLTLTYKAMSLSEIADKGKGSTNARHAQEAQDLYAKADRYEARGDWKNAEKYRAKAKEKESKIKKGYKDEGGKFMELRGDGQRDGKSGIGTDRSYEEVIHSGGILDTIQDAATRFIGQDTLSKLSNAWDLSGDLAKKGVSPDKIPATMAKIQTVNDKADKDGVLAMILDELKGFKSAVGIN